MQSSGSVRLARRSPPRHKIDVTVASRRAAEELAPQARAIAPTVIPRALDQALDAHTIFLAVPFGEAREVAKARPRRNGKTIVDVTNSYGTAPEELNGLLSSAFVAKAFTGARLVKGFNHLVRGQAGGRPGGRRRTPGGVFVERR